MAEKIMSKEEFRALKQQEKEMVFELLDAQTEAVKQSEPAFQQLLKLLAYGGVTTVSNALLAQKQLPATEEVVSVMSKDEWQKRNVPILQDENGYYPKGIFQIADDGEFIGKDNKPHKKYKIYRGYTAAQTRDPDCATSVSICLPQLSVATNGMSPQKVTNIALFNSSPVKCLQYNPKNFIDPAEDISKETGMMYIPQTKTVIVRAATQEQWFSRLSYEIALGLYHKETGASFTRSKFDFDAAVVSALLCIKYGQKAAYSFYPLQGEIFQLSPSAFRSRLGKCVELSHDISYRLQMKLKEIRAPSNQISSYRRNEL